MASNYRKNVERWPRRAGKRDLLRFIDGEKLTRSEAIQATCYECTCGESSDPCNVETCPLIQFCPWNK